MRLCCDLWESLLGQEILNCIELPHQIGQYEQTEIDHNGVPSLRAQTMCVSDEATKSPRKSLATNLVSKSFVVLLFLIHYFLNRFYRLLLYNLRLWLSAKVEIHQVDLITVVFSHEVV